MANIESHRLHPRNVLVILGASGTGKSTVAEAIARETGRSWLQVDDLRLALQFSGLLRQGPQDDLDVFFDPGIWTQPTRDVVQRLIRVTELMEPSLRVVIHSHVVTDAPVALEGDGIHPRLARDPLLQPMVEEGTVRFCCLSTPGSDMILENMIRRNRGIEGLSEPGLKAQAEAYAAFGAWLEDEAGQAGIPVIPSGPISSLPAKILNLMSQQQRRSLDGHGET